MAWIRKEYVTIHESFAWKPNWNNRNVVVLLSPKIQKKKTKIVYVGTHFVTWTFHNLNFNFSNGEIKALHQMKTIIIHSNLRCQWFQRTQQVVVKVHTIYTFHLQHNPLNGFVDVNYKEEKKTFNFVTLCVIAWKKWFHWTFFFKPKIICKKVDP